MGYCNINIIGPCNYGCYYCIGKELNEQVCGVNHLSVHWNNWPNFDRFLDTIQADGVEQVFLTGLNTDPLLYQYPDSLVEHLQGRGLYVGLRTNGLLAYPHRALINRCTAPEGGVAVAYSMTNPIDPIYHKRITRTEAAPDWGQIFQMTKVPYRVGLVLSEYNARHFWDILGMIQAKGSPAYVVVCKVSAIERTFQADWDAFDTLLSQIRKKHYPVEEYGGSETFLLRHYENLPPVRVNFWEKSTSERRSWNYYTDGVFSDEYMIIEGYLKGQSNKELVV
jgi:molybdenum cofactor biosynthesis enzyme MoaA